MTASIRLPPPKRSLSSRLSVLGGAAAAVLIAGVVYSVWPSINPTTQAPTFTIPPLQTGGSAGAITSTPAASPPAPVIPDVAAQPSSSRATGPTPIPPSAAPAGRAAAPPPMATMPAPPPAPPPLTQPVPEPAAGARPSPTPRPPDAADLLDAGARLEASGELVDALAAFERARAIDPSNVASANAVARIRARMTREGEAAFRDARQFDAVARVDDAVKAYEQAVKLLPDESPNKKFAKDRLDALRARK